MLLIHNEINIQLMEIEEMITKEEAFLISKGTNSAI